MRRSERKEFNEAWLEIENIITVIEPSLIPEHQFRRPESAGPKELKLLLGFLRLQVKMMLHDKESTERENMTLSNMVEQQHANNS